MSGLGDACDDDDDNDGVAEDVDLCPFDDSDNGQDQDGDGLGDPCDFDIDGDEVLNEDDNCPYIANTAQEDLDEDGLGDGCDDDTDGDEVLDSEDNCRSAVNPEQADLDLDGSAMFDDETDGDGLHQDNCLRCSTQTRQMVTRTVSAMPAMTAQMTQIMMKMAMRSAPTSITVHWWTMQTS